MRVAFVYPNPRSELACQVERGEAPDTGLLGQNHLEALGIEARIHDSRARRTRRSPGLAHRLTWFTRELATPWEVGRADVIVTPLASLLPLVAKLRSRPRTVLVNINVCTSLNRLTGARRRVLEASLRAADRIVCLAVAQRNELLTRVALDPTRVRLVRLGVDPDFYGPRPEPQTERVLAVGRDLGRDYSTFVRAIRSLGVPATIVASPRNLVGVSVPAAVEVELDVSPVRLRELYAKASCVVIPTRSAEFDRGADCSGQTVLLDGMASGRAVVLTRRSTLDDYVSDGETAVLVPPENAAALAAAIDQVVVHPELRRSLAANGRARVEREFTTKHFAAGLAPILRELT